MDYFNRNSDSPFGMLDVRLKMTLGFAISVLVVIVDTLVPLCVCAFAGIICFALCRPNKKQILLVGITTLLMIWGLMISQGLFYAQVPRHAIVVLLDPNLFFKTGLKIYAEGIHYGAVQSLRMIAATLAGYAICFSTEPDQFLRGLRAVRIPFSLSFMAVSAIRFIPVVAQEIVTVRNAMRLKGYRPFRYGFIDTVRSEISALRPILAGTIRRSEEMALSIQTRGFSIIGKRSSWVETTFSQSNKILLWSILGFVFMVVICKTLFWLYQWEILYTPALRPLYGFVRYWL